MWTENSQYSDGTIGEDQVNVKIYLTSTVPIHSYSFTLEGFGNILSATSDDPSDIIAGSALNFGSKAFKTLSTLFTDSLFNTFSMQLIIVTICELIISY